MFILEAETSTSSDLSEYSDCSVWRPFVADSSLMSLQQEKVSTQSKKISLMVGYDSCLSIITSFLSNDIAHTS